MHAPAPSHKRRKTFVMRLRRALSGTAGAVVTACVAFPGGSAAQSVGARSTSAGVSSAFTSSDLLMLGVGGAAALVFSVSISRLVALICARQMTVTAQRMTSVSVEPEAIRAGSLADAPATRVSTA